MVSFFWTPFLFPFGGGGYYYQISLGFYVPEICSRRQNYFPFSYFLLFPFSSFYCFIFIWDSRKWNRKRKIRITQKSNIFLLIFPLLIFGFRKQEIQVTSQFSYVDLLLKEKTFYNFSFSFFLGFLRL